MTSNDTDFPPTGGLRPINASLPKLSGSTPTPSPKPSSSGGSRARDARSSAATTAGASHGAAGAVATQTAGVEARRRKVARQIGLPEAAASLVPLLGSALDIAARDVYAGRELDGFEFTATAKDDARAIEAAREALRPWLKPMQADDALRLIAELALITKRREGDDTTDEATVAAYARRLAEYPTDAAAEVVRTWGGVFWPAWAELQAHLDRKVRARRVFAKALGL
jgi:hypothetical protein